MRSSHIKLYARGDDLQLKSNSNRLQLHAPSSSATANWDKYKTKKYLHFDTPLNIKRVKHLIQDPKFIQSHAFLPFIHFDIIFNQYVLRDPNDIRSENPKPKDLKVKRDKVRSIMYASHIDQFIYKYYGDYLNEKYNKYADKLGIDDIVLAYRNNKKGQNNIHFSKEVFDFILSQNEAIIISLDFSSFFDNINHRALKNNIKTIFNESEIPNDVYHVFKNTTKFSYVSKTDIDSFLLHKYGKDKLKELKKNHELKKIMSNQEFRQFKKNYLFKNKKPYGIPQGSGMSAVCSNIHLIHFDKEVDNWAKQHNALYRRYSDDLILVIPSNSTGEKAEKLVDQIIEIISKYNSAGLKVQKEKTEIRTYKNKQIYNEKGEHSTLDYLGLVIDGKKVQLREKSLFKYYSRAYRKARVCRNITLKTGKKYGRKSLYQIYTHLGYDYKGHGNFIKYARDAHSIMKSTNLESNIQNQIKRHWNKIHRVLNQSV